MNRTERERNYWNDIANCDNPDQYIADTATLDGCLAAVLPYLGNRKTIVELGSGVGRLTSRVARALPDAVVIGIDISEQLTAIAQDRSRGIHNCFYFVNDGQSIPVKPPIDALYCVTVFQHLTWPTIAMYVNEASAIMTHGGVFRFQFIEGYEQEPFSRHYSRHDMKELLYANDFMIDEWQVGLIYPQWSWVTAVRL